MGARVLDLGQRSYGKQGFRLRAKVSGKQGFRFEAKVIHNLKPIFASTICHNPAPFAVYLIQNQQLERWLERCFFLSFFFFQKN